MKLITDVLREIRGGAAVVLASELLAEVVQAAIETGKKGELTLKLSIEPDEQDGNQIVVEADVKAKKPHRSVPTSVFYADREGGLHRVDPRQREMFEEAAPRTTGTGRA